MTLWHPKQDRRLRQLTHKLLGRGLSPQEAGELEVLRATMLDCQARLAGSPPVPRRFVRATLQVPCEMQTRTGVAGRGETANVGTGGVCLRVDQPSRAGETVYVTLELAGNKLLVQGETRWLARQGGKWHVGVQYAWLATPIEAILSRFVLDSASKELLVAADERAE